jgi:hypothetical protein
LKLSFQAVNLKLSFHERVYIQQEGLGEVGIQLKLDYIENVTTLGSGLIRVEFPRGVTGPQRDVLTDHRCDVHRGELDDVKFHLVLGFPDHQEHN